MYIGKGGDKQSTSVHGPKRHLARRPKLKASLTSSKLSTPSQPILQNKMRHIEALVLLSTAVTSILGAESSRPRGVGPECRHSATPSQYAAVKTPLSNTNPLSSREILQIERDLPVHLDAVHRPPHLRRQRRLLRLPRRLRRARHQRLHIPLSFVPAAARSGERVWHQQRDGGAAGVLLQEQRARAGLRAVHARQ